MTLTRNGASDDQFRVDISKKLFPIVIYIEIFFLSIIIFICLLVYVYTIFYINYIRCYEKSQNIIV